MIYSFIKPKLKPLISQLSKIWLIFIGFIVVIMLVFDIFAIIRTSFLNSGVKDFILTQEDISKEKTSIDGKIEKLLAEKNAVEGIYASNDILKKSLKNLFDLVPDQITLSKVQMDKNSLILYGSTPSKDTYNFLLASPLRSIFNTTNTTFYQNKKGWYRFVSTNKINNPDGFNE